MKICLVSRYFDFRNAGLGRVGMKIAEELQNRGHEVTLISTNGESLYSYFFYTALELPIRIWRFPYADIYHAITPMEAMWLPKDRSVVTFHDLFQFTDVDRIGSGMGYSRWKRAIGSRWYRYACSRAKGCAGIVAVSRATAQDLTKYLGIPKERIRVIPSGINNSLDYIPNNDFTSRVGYLGQLDRRKRVDLLIKAFKGSNLNELVIGGTGVDGDMLRELAGYDARIRFLGRVPDKGLPRFYNSLDAFVFPTWLEGYGLPIVEAMACKKPVVVLADARMPEEVKSRCIVLEDLWPALHDSDNLEHVCKHTDIEGNYQWAKAHRWSRTIDNYEEVYQKVLDGDVDRNSKGRLA